MKILTKRLEALDMIAVYMTEKARERVVPPRNSSKIVNLYEVSDTQVQKPQRRRTSNVKKLWWSVSPCA